MVRQKVEVALEWVGLMRQEIERLKSRLDWLDRGCSYIELYLEQQNHEENNLQDLPLKTLAGDETAK